MYILCPFQKYPGGILAQVLGLGNAEISGYPRSGQVCAVREFGVQVPEPACVGAFIRGVTTACPGISMVYYIS